MQCRESVAMDRGQSARYPLERRDGEIERLHLQGQAMVPETEAMLDRIGVRPGWTCLDLGCGPAGITPLLSARVGNGGRVVGLDADPVFLEHGRAHTPANVEYVLADAYRSGLPDGSFDLAHVRFVAGTAGRPEALIGEAMRLVRAGGTVALQEPDMTTLDCYPPHPAFARLKDALVSAFTVAGADIMIARRLFGLMRDAGLQDVQFRPFLLGFRSVDPMSTYLPMTTESLRGTIVGAALMAAPEMDAALAECRHHLSDPGTVSTLFTVAQVWGRKPITSARKKAPAREENPAR
jgi:SAM-dependent methyltransferase